MRKQLLLVVFVFVGAAAAKAQSLPEMRLTSSDVESSKFGDNKTGS
jgi:hypothetical protein